MTDHLLWNFMAWQWQENNVFMMANMRCKVNKSRKQKGTLHKWNQKSFRLCSVLFLCPPGAKHKCTERRDIPGSVAFVPSVAGLIIAGEVVKDLCR